MKTSSTVPAIVLGFVLIASVAHAQDDAPISVVSSQFTDKVEAGKPVGDASAIGATATYFVVAQNAKEATQITLVWKLDDKEAVRQTLDVGTSPRWRTWGSCPTKKAHAIEVDVLDANGAVIKTDKLDRP